MNRLILDFNQLNVEGIVKEQLLIGLYPCVENITEYNRIINNEVTCEQLCKQKCIFSVNNKNDLRNYLKEVVQIRNQPYIKDYNNQIKLIIELLRNVNVFNYKYANLTHNAENLYNNLNSYPFDQDLKEAFLKQYNMYMKN